MAERETFERVVERLQSAPAAIQCNEMRDMLESLGFEVRDAKKAGHKVVVHHGIPAFTSAAYTCGHGKNPVIKRVYVMKILAILKQYENELIEQ